MSFSLRKKRGGNLIPSEKESLHLCDYVRVLDMGRENLTGPHHGHEPYDFFACVI